MKKLIRCLLLILVGIVSITFLVKESAYASPIDTSSGWSNTGGPIYLNNTGSIYYNSSNDVGGVKGRMRASYTYKSRRTRVLGYRLMQSQLYPLGKDGYYIPIAIYTDVQHPDGRMGYTEWFDSPYGVYFDYQQSRLPAMNAARNDSLEKTIVADTINYNKSINNPSTMAVVSTSNNHGELADAKGASILLRRGIIDASIYLSYSTTVDSNVKNELKRKGIKTVYLTGGFSRFNNDALFNDGFNVIRIGGNNRQHTFELSTNMPNQAKTPPRKFANVEGGFIIEGLTPGTTKYNAVKNHLTKLRDTKNMNHLQNAFNYLIKAGNIGTLDSVRDWSSPIITIGVNYDGFETYCSIYASTTAGRYIYNVVAPGYFSKPNLKNEGVSIGEYEYREPNTNNYWVQKDNEFTITAKSSLSTNVYTWMYPMNEIYMTDDLDRKVGIRNDESLGYQNSFNTVFKGISLRYQKKWRDGSKNYTENRIAMKSSNHGKSYKVGEYTLLVEGHSTWWGGYYTKDHYVKVDGKPPKSEWDPASKLQNINTLYIMQQHIYDEDSGLVGSGNNRPWAYVYMNNTTNKGSKILLTKHDLYWDYYTTVDLPKHIGNNYGDIRIEIWARDNVGNEGKIKDYTINRPHPKPTTESVTIKEYEYEDSTTKWVQAGNEFQIDQRGYNSHTYPTQSNIRISKDSNHENTSTSNAYAMTTSSYVAWSTNDKNFVKTRDTLLNLWEYASNKYGQAGYYFKANSELNGKKYQVWGKTETKISTGKDTSTVYHGSWVKDSKLLGIDAVAPRISFVKTGRDEIKVTVSDAESGVKGSKVVLDNGTAIHFTTSKVVNLNGSKNAYIESTDNVGNVSDKVSIGDIKTKVTSTLTTEVVTISGRKMLKVTATGRVTNPVPGKVMTWRLKGTGDGIRYTDATNKVMNSATGGSYNYSTNIDDVYNQSFGPPLRKGGNIDNVAYVDLTHINDIDKAYSFSLEEKYDYESSWIVEKSHTTNFNSGRKHYKFEVLKLSDKDFNPISPRRVNSQDTMTGNRIDFNYYETGDYKVKVTMYDYNNNPSGTTELPFRHIQPLVYTKLEGEVTAIKDLAWEKETYPINFADTGKFPLGEAYKFNGNGIKLGYGVNFNFKIPTSQPIDHYKIEYSYYSSDGQLLTGYSNGKSFTDSDSQDGSSYTVQNSNFSFNGRFVYVKHFAPADATFKLSNGSTYNGLVTVRAKMTFSRGSYSTSKTIDLYTVTTDETAFDDLQLDKQR